MPDVLSGYNMVNSINVGHGNFLQIINSLPRYAEVVIILLILVLLVVSFDEIIDFINFIRACFVYPAPPISP